MVEIETKGTSETPPSEEDKPKKRARVEDKPKTIVCKEVFDNETTKNPLAANTWSASWLIKVGDGEDMALEVGLNHWSQAQWLMFGFKGERSKWQDFVRLITIHIHAFTPTTCTDLDQTVTFDPTHPMRVWTPCERDLRAFPGFALPLGLEFTGGYVGKWTCEAIIQLK